jgi:tetratricopeptide (TPR) repeat protein
LALYEKALQLSPNNDEARAAHYNAACAYAKLKQWPQAAESVKAAVNDYDLKLQVALEVR